MSSHTYREQHNKQQMMKKTKRRLENQDETDTLTRWHGSTGQRRRTYSGCIASAFAHCLFPFDFFFAVGTREASAAYCAPSPAARYPVLCLSKSNQPVESNQPIPTLSCQHSVSGPATHSACLLHSPQVPIIARALFPNAPAKRAAAAAGLSSHVRRRHPIGGTLGICLGKLKDKVAAQSSSLVNWPVAKLGGTQAKSIGQWLTPRHPHRSSRDSVHLSSALHYKRSYRVLNI